MNARVTKAPINVGMLPNLLGFNLDRARMTLRRSFNRAYQGSGVRPGVFTLLNLIGNNPGVAQTDLARQLMVDKSTVAGLIRGLLTREWVKHEPSPRDRRRDRLTLTPLGQQALERLWNEMREHETRYTRLFSPSELTQLIAYLRRIHCRPRKR
jgi:DNA-binding MarR family transcriptional regulator